MLKIFLARCQKTVIIRERTVLAVSILREKDFGESKNRSGAF